MNCRKSRGNKKYQEETTIKSIPNAITSTRIVFSVILLFTVPMSGLFFMLYVLCGASDILDGYFARKMNSSSRFGALLDSIADFLFSAVVLFKLMMVIKLAVWQVIWLVFIVIIKTASLLIGFKKYHSLAFLHTYFNKATGLLLFCFPLFYTALGLAPTAFMLLGIATIAAMEELLLNLTAKELDYDVKSIFAKVK